MRKQCRTAYKPCMPAGKNVEVNTSANLFICSPSTCICADVNSPCRIIQRRRPCIKMEQDITQYLWSKHFYTSKHKQISHLKTLYYHHINFMRWYPTQVCITCFVHPCILVEHSQCADCVKSQSRNSPVSAPVVCTSTNTILVLNRKCPKNFYHTNIFYYTYMPYESHIHAHEHCLNFC